MQPGLVIAGILIVCVAIMVVFWKRTHKGHKKAAKKCDDLPVNSPLAQQEQEIDRLIDQINNG
jgi:hypothetical protein